jgi:hypothetical protein
MMLDLGEPKYFLYAVYPRMQICRYIACGSVLTIYSRVWMVTTVRSITASAQSAMSLHVLLDRQINIFIEELEKIKHVVGLIPSLTFQPITLNEIRNFRKNGGNALGIEESDGPLVGRSINCTSE